MMLDDETDGEDGGKGKDKKGTYFSQVGKEGTRKFEKTADKVFDVGTTISAANDAAIT